jgi:hypothetical protein
VEEVEWLYNMYSKSPKSIFHWLRRSIYINVYTSLHTVCKWKRQLEDSKKGWFSLLFCFHTYPTPNHILPSISLCILMFTLPVLIYPNISLYFQKFQKFGKYLVIIGLNSQEEILLCSCLQI